MMHDPIFNNREIAIAVWFVLLLAFCLTKDGARASLRAMAHAFLQRQMLIMYSLMIAYVAAIVWALGLIGMWEVRQLKDTIVWFVVVAATSFFRLPKNADDIVYFKEALIDNIKLIVVIEFIVSFYTGSIFVELLLVPFSTLLGLMIVFAERDQRYAVAATFLNRLAMLLGASILIYAIYQLATNVFGFATLETLADFSLPAILTVLFLPFIFATTLIVNYQTTFSTLHYAIKDDHLRLYAKRKSLLRFGWRTSLVKRWKRSLFLEDHRTKEDINRSIRVILERRERERNPPSIPASQGWSPYAAREFLGDNGLTTGYYEPVTGEEWYASKSRDSSDRNSLSTFEYSVEGDSVSATTLRLELDAFQSKPPVTDMKEFMVLVAALYHAALEHDMPFEFMKVIMEQDNVERTVDGRVISTVSKPWSYNGRDRFTLEFYISVTAPSR
jgi:hypothetical protein